MRALAGWLMAAIFQPFLPGPLVLEACKRGKWETILSINKREKNGEPIIGQWTSMMTSPGKKKLRFLYQYE